MLSFVVCFAIGFFAWNFVMGGVTLPPEAEKVRKQVESICGSDFADEFVAGYAAIKKAEKENLGLPDMSDEEKRAMIFFGEVARTSTAIRVMGKEKWKWTVIAWHKKCQEMDVSD